MRILFDHGTPRGLAKELIAHSITTARAMGWDRLSNGELLKAAEDAPFDLFLTTDGRIRYQQNLAGRTIAILVLTGTSKWSRVHLHCEEIAAAIDACTPGSYTEVYISFR